jgi:hypothetical protein
MRRSRRCQPDRSRDNARRYHRGHHALSRPHHLMRFTRTLLIGNLQVIGSDRALKFPGGPTSFLRFTKRTGPTNPRRWVG